MSKPDKKLTVGGLVNAEVGSDPNQLIITPQGGLVVVTTFDTRGLVMWMHHPLSGWYIEVDNRRPETTEDNQS